MFFYHFLQLCSRGHVSKMLAVRVIKNTVTKRLWNFQIRFLPYSNAFEKNFFFKHVLLLFSSTLSPRSCLENACCNCYQKHPFGIFKSVSCLIRMRLRKNKFSNMFFYHFLQLCSRGHVSKMLAVTVIKNTPLEFSNPFPALF